MDEKVDLAKEELGSTPRSRQEVIQLSGSGDRYPRWEPTELKKRPSFYPGSNYPKHIAKTLGIKGHPFSSGQKLTHSCFIIFKIRNSKSGSKFYIFNNPLHGPRNLPSSILIKIICNHHSSNHSLHSDKHPKIPEPSSPILLTTFPFQNTIIHLILCDSNSVIWNQYNASSPVTLSFLSWFRHSIPYIWQLMRACNTQPAIWWLLADLLWISQNKYLATRLE